MKTVTLETAKKLKSAGYPQDSYFWWKKIVFNGVKQTKLYIQKPVDYPENAYWAAPTAEEVLERLPAVVKFKKKTKVSSVGWQRLYMWMGGDDFEREKSFHIGYHDRPETAFKADTLAEATALMWLYLREHNLI